ncbi:MAG: ABC transporter permease [Lewinellaceae bacterium]|nr:ABC transporter permease [Lewinellaceae bacterium]
MLKNFIRTAFRNFRRNGLYTSLNLAGLTVGFAGFLLLGLYITDELRFDALHTKVDRIYRLVEEKTDADGKTTRVAATSYLAAERGKQDLPEIAEVVKIGASGRSNVYTTDPKQAFHEVIWHADGSFGQVFDFQWLLGDPKTAFVAPNSVVLTREFARRLFGTDQVLGKALTVEDYQPLTVTGVLEDFPKNSSIHFNLAVSTATYDEDERFQEAKVGDWTSNNFPTWVLLQPDANPAAVETKLNTLIAANTPAGQTQKRHHSLLPMRDIHFKGTGIEGLSDRMANAAYVTVLTLVALFLLGIACINYINLTTARAAGRGKEVGVRKVVGAGQRHMIGQFLTETYLLVTAAFVLAVVSLQLILPAFNEFAGKALMLNASTDPTIWASAAGTALLVGLLAGIYPAMYLARLRPTILFKNILPGNWWEFSLRKGLVVAQFGLSALLMIATGIVWRQMRFLENKDLGFTRDQLVVVDINSGKVRRDFQTVKAGYAQIPGVEAVSVTSRVPGEWKVLPQVVVSREGADLHAETKTASLILADEDFLNTYQVPLLSGRNFEPNGTDSAAVMLNESAAALLGITEPSGQWITIPSAIFSGTNYPMDQPFKAQVVGIVRDFHFRSLREKIAPLVLGARRNPVHAIDYFTVRIQAANAQAVLPRLEEVLRATDPGHQFEWHFLNEQWALFYREDVRRQKILTASAGGAIFIACLGLFGLATFAAERRRKEIGIRKVLGASLGSITGLLTRDFLKLVVIGLFIASPVAWWAMNKWLSDFAYRIEMEWWMFVLAGAAAMVIALVTVGGQAMKAALADPAKSLKSE